MVRRKKVQSNRTLLQICLLLVKFFLISIGSLVTSLTKLLFQYRLSILAATAILVLIYVIFSIQNIKTLPFLEKLKPTERPLTTEFYDRDGQLLYRLYDSRNRSLINLEDLPPFVWQASVAIEDKHFFSHPGVDPTALARAAWQNLHTTDLQGGSTITQQLVKNTIVTPEKTVSRKIKEIFLSLCVEAVYSKQQILEMYLNEAPYGGTAWGVESAALTYFGKHTEDLSLAEAAYLAGLPASPTEFSPYGTNPDLGKLRERQVLAKMTELGYINPDQQQAALKEELHIKTPINEIKAPHFIMYVKSLLSQKYGDKAVLNSGLKIVTTLDSNLQEKTEEIVKSEVKNLKSLNVQNGAAMILDPKTGQILSLVGSKDYFDPQFGNYNAALALRQPGSSIKVITYAEAFKQGFSPGNTILDIPVSFPDGDKKYSPINYDSRFHGPVSLRIALGSSYNIPAVKLLSTVGLNKMIQTAKDMGITTFNDPRGYGLSLTLGGGEIRMIDMMAVYSTISQLGVYRKPTPILKVTDSYGQVLEEFSPEQKQVLQPEVAFLVTDILTDDKARSPAFGYHSLLYIPNAEVAVKTGTSDNKRDNWTYGFTPDFVVGVWVGNNDNSPMNPALTSGVTGATPIWNKIVHLLVDGKKIAGFEKPGGITETMVDSRKDLVLTNTKPKNLVKIRQIEDQLIFSDPFSSLATTSAQANQTRLQGGIN